MFNLVALLALLVPVGGALSSPPVLPVDGEPFFVLGWYTGYLSPSVEASRQYLSTMRHQGMNTALICYGIIYYDPHMTNQLEGAVDADMKIMVEVNRRAVQQLPGYPLSLIDYQVDLCAPYQSLLGWYLIDEPEGNGVTPSMAQTGYARVKTRDPNRPISVAHMAYAGQPAKKYLEAEPPPYCDVLMTDTYDVGENSPEFTSILWRNALQSRIHTQLAVDHAKQAYINIVQAFECCEKWRIPTPAETRYLSYAPVVQGARGLLYWLHSDDYTTPEHRDRVVPVVAHEIQSLVPAIISNSTALSITSDRSGDTTGHGLGDVTWLFGVDGRRGSLIAVNNTAQTLAAAFQLSGSVLADALPSGNVTIPVLFEQRNVELQATGDPNVRTLSDTFAPYDVNVYLLYESSPAPPTPVGLPAQANSPHPADQSVSIGASFDLSWHAVDDAASYDVYFGSSSPPAYRGNQWPTTFDPAALNYDTTYYWRVDTVNGNGVTQGNTWTFRTVPRNPPAKVSNPSPAPSSLSGTLSPVLTWRYAPGARSYNVYFGDVSPPPFRQNQTGYSFYPGTLQNCTTYYWRIDPVNDDGTTTGDVWNFMATNSPFPAQPSGPNPANAATDIRLWRTTLSWVGAYTDEYLVHFGTETPPLFRRSQTGTTYAPGLLLPRTTYYWRIDAVGQCTTVQGPLWSFTTGSIAGDFDEDNDVDQEDFGKFQVCLSGSCIAYPAGCADADLDADADVDQHDWELFQRCMSGANVPADPNCAN